MCNRVFLCLQRSCVRCFSVVQRKMLVFPYAVRGRACVVWPAGAWVTASASVFQLDLQTYLHCIY